MICTIDYNFDRFIQTADIYIYTSFKFETLYLLHIVQQGDMSYTL